MNEWEAKVERARLQALLDVYEADRQHQRREGEPNGTQRELSPDRADNVRARIARLDQIIRENHGR
jgi:hypothetical protein